MNWSNKNMEYSRNRRDWMVLCKICHARYDHKKYNVFSNKRGYPRYGKIGSERAKLPAYLYAVS